MNYLYPICLDSTPWNNRHAKVRDFLRFLKSQITKESKIRKKDDISVDVSGCLRILEVAGSGQQYFVFSNRFRSPLSTLLRFIFSRAFYIQSFAKRFCQRLYNYLTPYSTPSLGALRIVSNVSLHGPSITNGAIHEFLAATDTKNKSARRANEVSRFHENDQTGLSDHLHRTRNVNNAVFSYLCDPLTYLAPAVQRRELIRA